MQQPLCTILFLLHHPAHHKCACTQSTSYCCWASALTSVRRSCVLRFNQSFCSLESCHGRFSSRLTASISAFFSGGRAEQVCRCGRHDLCQRIFRLPYTRRRFYSRGTHVSPCVPLCAIFLRKPSVYPLSGVRANVGRLCEKLKSGMKSGWGIKFMAAALPDFSLLLIVGVHREPGNVCI